MLLILKISLLLFFSARFQFRHVDIPEFISQYSLSHQNIRFAKKKKD